MDPRPAGTIQRGLSPLLRNPPAFTLPDLDGIQHSSASHVGRPTLVHFFATWCEACREELDTLARLLARGDAPQFSVMAISVAEPPVRVRRYFEGRGVNFPVLLDPDRGVARRWGVDVLPTTFVLDLDRVPRLGTAAGRSEPAIGPGVFRKK